MSKKDYYDLVSDWLCLFHMAERVYGGRKYAWYFEPGHDKWLFLAACDHQAREGEYLLNSTYVAPKINTHEMVGGRERYRGVDETKPRFDMSELDEIKERTPHFNGPV